MLEQTSTTPLPVQQIRSEFDAPVAADYLLKLFEPSDRIALMFLKKGEDVRHKFMTAEEAASSSCLEQLQKANAAGWNVYVCMNPLKADRRVKENIAAIRNVYLDVNENGKTALDNVFQSSLVPEPNFVLQSSPDKFYFVWCVEPGLSASEQESLLKALVREFRADPAATDATWVLRLPGFVNHKYPDKPLVEIIHWGPDKPYARGQFKVSLKPIEQKIEHDADPRFLALREAVGFRPLVRRMNALPDPGSHVDSPDLEPGDLYSCPFHKHSDFTPNFGAIRENPLMAHCLGKCGGSWDVVSAVAQFDNLKTQFDAARVICKEENLNYEKFFPKECKDPKPKAEPKKKEISSVCEQDTEELEPEITEEPLPEFPQITGSIAEFADALCPDIPREFKIMAAVTRIGLMLTGKVSLANETHLQPRFYTCAIADKGRGKSASNSEVGRRLNSLGDYHNTP
jgi:DNA primase RepB-like protein